MFLVYLTLAKTCGFSVRKMLDCKNFMLQASVWGKTIPCLWEQPKHFWASSPMLRVCHP